MGYGVIRSEGSRLICLDYGCVYTKPDEELPQRLIKLHDGISALIAQYEPDAVSIEELFFNRNVKTALTVGYARGVALLAVAKTGCPLYEYTPIQVKQAVVGYGRAEKNQVQQMVKILLNMPDAPKPDDAADGLALAVTHAHSSHASNLFKVK
jgi:crossover junction endodeoxyribonuclease RuvC